MDQAILKVKVLFGFGALVTFLGMLYMPAVIKALVPVAICIFLTCIVFYTPELVRELKRGMARRNGMASQATSFINSLKNKNAPVAVSVKSIPHIDYENYQIPSYLRRQEVK